jgi:hypothetical protein
MERFTVHVQVLTHDFVLFDRWFAEVPKLAHPRLLDIRGRGTNQAPDDSEVYDTRLVVEAADEADACALAASLIDGVIGDAPYERRFDIEVPRERPKPWQRHEACEGGVTIAWFSGLSPLGRVDVEETDARVTITLWEARPPAAAGEQWVLVGDFRRVDVPLAAPLGARELVDGATGRRAGDIDPFDVTSLWHRAHLHERDLGTIERVPMP